MPPCRSCLRPVHTAADRRIQLTGRYSRPRPVRTVNPNINSSGVVSDMFGKSRDSQTEIRRSIPQPLGVSKVLALHPVNSRESYDRRGLGILSPRVAAGAAVVRDPNVTEGVAAQARGGDSLSLVNLDAQRDWCFRGLCPRDVVCAHRPQHYVIATRISHSRARVGGDRVHSRRARWQKYVSRSKFLRRQRSRPHRDPAKRSGGSAGHEMDFKQLIEMMGT